LVQTRDTDGQGTTESSRISNRYLYGDAVDQVLADELYVTTIPGPITTQATTTVAAPVASTTAGSILWTVGDHLGSIRDLVDILGTTRQHVVYDSFGKRLTEVDRNTAGTVISSTNALALDTVFGYTGREWDKETGLQNNRARPYDPATGRFISQDPIGFEARDPNLYRYVGNGVTTKTDPSGLEEWMIHLHDHGAPHIQLGNSRWDAITLEPVKHKGKTPPPLTTKQLEEIRQCDLWDRLVKNVDRTQLETAIRARLTQEVYEEAKKRGFRSLTKDAAKDIARFVLGKTPIALFFVAISAREALADCQSKGSAYAVANQLIPVSLIDSIGENAAESYTDWRQRERQTIWNNRMKNGGF
jgi:RHS repeat-associated protein